MTQLSEGRLGKIEAEVLNDYGLEFKDFNIQEYFLAILKISSESKQG